MEVCEMPKICYQDKNFRADKYNTVKEKVEKEKEVMIDISNDWDKLYNQYS